MTRPAISAAGIGKEYVIGGPRRRTDLREAFAEAARKSAVFVSEVLRGRMPGFMRSERFWALKDVSFEVAAGKALGIIGRNGSGKSTLLKILSRVTPPTEGEATTVGRIGSLLEIGAGFHKELTGRENVFLSGTILGMKRREIVARFDEIVEFSGVQQFIDTPVKRYSSGMYLRLAFAVAAHLDSEILLVDEVLAVGDSAFQKTCLEKLSSLVRDGRTVMFVSHNLAAVSRVCELALVLDRGRVVHQGEAASAIAYYEQRSARPATGDPERQGRGLSIRSLRVKGRSEEIVSGQPLGFQFDLTLPRDYWTVSMGFGLRTLEGERMVFDVLDSRGAPNLCRSGTYEVSISLPALWLRPRTYVVQAKVTAYPAVGEFDKFLTDTFEFVVHGNDTSGLLDPFLQPPVAWSVGTPSENGEREA